MEPTQKLIYDRSFKDVQRVAELNRKISAGSASAEEVQEWFSAKGALNYEDLNRIESWTEFLSNKLKSYGYNAPITKRAEQTYTYYEKPEPGDEPVVRLPEGYRELTYIESTGTQYIDTGFKPKHNTRTVLEVSSVTTVDKFMFGAKEADAGNASLQYACLIVNTTTIRSDYFGTNARTTVANITDKTTVDKNGSTQTAWGKVITNTAVSSGEVPCTMHLFAANIANKAQHFSSIKLYNCQIYDNDTLVRDYIPCINAQGTAGLYDVVNDVFYINKGTGVFETGGIIEYVENVGGGPSGPTEITVTHTDWRVWDIPQPTEINRIRDNVNRLRSGFYRISDWREIAYKNNPNYEEVNSLEWDMQTIYNWLKLMVLNFKYSGEVYAGEAW